ncbi:MAG: serine/threonine-protein kinase [Deltaproteobacteria bacterium]|nr:serine/threonine-protein kinase [Deltaproteobacteria bacterium]
MRQCPTCQLKFWGESETVCPNDGSSLQEVVIANDRTRLLGAMIHGRYLVDGVLGDGGMGVVYRAKDQREGRPVAIKVLRAEYSAEEDLVARFEVEANAVAAINHQHIIKVYEFGRLEDGSHFFVMEMLEGRSLGEVMHQAGKGPDGARRPLSLDLAMHIARQICLGLGAAHRAGIVHRDMKPDNVQLIRVGDDSAFVKILDFGIAKVANSKAARTRTGSVFGTPQYMSPEQAGGERDIDPRTDIYAVGVLLYEMLAGRLPFDGDTLMAVLAAHIYQPPIPLRTIPAARGVSAAVESVVLKALQKDRTQRYDTIDEFAEDIARLQIGAEPRSLDDAEPTTVQQRSSIMPPAFAPAPSVPPPPMMNAPVVLVQPTISPVTRARPETPKASSSAAWVGGLALVGLLAFGGAGLMIYRRAQPGADTAREVNLDTPQVTTEPDAGSATATIEIDSLPSGATLTAATMPACVTPCTIPRGTQPRDIVVSLEGYQTAQFRVEADGPERLQVLLSREQAATVRTRVIRTTVTRTVTTPPTAPNTPLLNPF